MNKDLIPRHIAIVMDGNGRWAKAKHRPRLFGHHQGVEVVRDVVKICNNIGVGCLTLFAFSSENWRRPEEEVSGLMKLFMMALEKEAKSLVRNGVRLEFIGDRSAFSEKLQKKMAQVEGLTSKGTGLRLLIAGNYGGRWDIVQAARKMVLALSEEDADSAHYDEATFGRFVSTQQVPDPDLFIRTGGERRISNFLLWQLAYTELYFTDVLWPDFNKQEL
ncbi:PREDICTED: ditrans,polycis-undecaprenyl-diphosphate synthase ((2E,6E)-farnesyl-diphosphate specific)-like, partial [Priapulus caudatus]|uniref:Alkyl transferase n=1 Tax=Priapulus caudatus TaxID=37621 RepID=A0ABM1F6J9_PRICU